MTNVFSETLEKLEGILEVERHMVREGNFDKLDMLAEEKEAAMHALSLHSDSAQIFKEQLVRVASIAARNQRLIGAALKGIRAAERRLEMILRANKSLNSYDRLGRAKTIGGGSNNVEHRA
jgi:flagellar biosynthesis/type III secretory pathway chaperone